MQLRVSTMECAKLFILLSPVRLQRNLISGSLKNREPETVNQQTISYQYQCCLTSQTFIKREKREKKKKKTNRFGFLTVMNSTNLMKMEDLKGSVPFFFFFSQYKCC